MVLRDKGGEITRPGEAVFELDITGAKLQNSKMNFVYNTDVKNHRYKWEGMLSLNRRSKRSKTTLKTNGTG